MDEAGAGLEGSVTSIIWTPSFKAVTAAYVRPLTSKTSTPNAPFRALKPPRPSTAAETGLRVGGPAEGSCIWDCASNARRMAPVSASIWASICGSDPPVSGLPASSARRMAPVSASIRGMSWGPGSPPNMDPNKSNMTSNPPSDSGSPPMPSACRMAPVSASIWASICVSDPPVSGLPTSSASRMTPVSASICAIVWLLGWACAPSTAPAPDAAAHRAMQTAVANMRHASAVRMRSQLDLHGRVRCPALHSMRCVPPVGISALCV